MDLGEKISDDAYAVTVADGHEVGADIYKSTIEINGVKKEVEVCVVDPNNIKGRANIEDTCILLGRGFLDHFDVEFKGIKNTSSS